MVELSSSCDKGLSARDEGKPGAEQKGEIATSSNVVHSRSKENVSSARVAKEGEYSLPCHVQSSSRARFLSGEPAVN